MRLHAVVRGRVQGVGFRWFVRECATTLDLAGWVKNRPDGSVEVAAEGEPDSIDRLRRELSVGPRGARVEAVDTVDDVAIDLGQLERPFMIVRH